MRSATRDALKGSATIPFHLEKTFILVPTASKNLNSSTIPSILKVDSVNTSHPFPWLLLSPDVD